MKLKVTMMAAAGLLLPLVPIAAHRSFAAEYDANKPLKMMGKVTKAEWTNPHARFYLDVAHASGKVTNWNFELASPNGKPKFDPTACGALAAGNARRHPLLDVPTGPPPF